MKRFLLTTVALAALASTNALAADIPARVSRAPVVVAPVCQWCGFYIGLNAGFLWSDQDFTIPTIGAVGNDLSGFTGGGQIGYNWQFGNSPIVVGIEADIQGAWADSSASFGPVAIAGLGLVSGTASFDLDSWGTVRGRLGYAANNWLIYVTGGWAYGGASSSATLTSTVLGTFVATGSGSSNNGWTFGGGVEGKFAPNWSARLEYLFVRFPGDDVAVPAAFGGGVVTTADFDMHVVRGAINYHFGAIR